MIRTTTCIGLLQLSWYRLKYLSYAYLRKVETKIITSDNQFGFKRESGTDLRIFTIESVIKYYNLHNSP